MTELDGENQMEKYNVTATRIPTNYNDPRSFIVEAETPQDAIMLVKEDLHDLSGLSNYAYSAQKYEPPTSKGRIISRG